MLTIFWDVSGLILVHFHEKGQTVTSAWYNDMLVKRWSPRYDQNAGDFSQKEYCCFMTTPASIRLRRQWIHYVLWNLRCWNIQHTVRTLCHQTFTCLDLWKNICGARCFPDDEVMEAVQSWLKTTPKSFFLEGIHKLVDRWTKCVAKQGDYVRK